MPIDLKKWKARRKEIGITYDELAKRSDVSISALYDIFSGKTTSPRIDNVQAIESILFEGITELAPAESYSADEKKLISMYRELPTERRPYILQFVADQLDFIKTYGNF